MTERLGSWRNSRTLGSELNESVRQGVPVLALLVVLDALLVPAAIGVQHAFPSTGPPAGPPKPISWMNPSYAAEQGLIHILAGFVVGLLTLSFSKALIGAVMGPLIDIDHVSALVGFPSAARDGHSIVLLACLILLVSALGLWRWGRVDFALFSTAQFAAHFAVAPPGFPLLSPFATILFKPPALVFALVVALCLFAVWSRGSRPATPSLPHRNSWQA
jgi:hypothetical protein